MKRIFLTIAALGLLSTSALAYTNPCTSDARPHEGIIRQDMVEMRKKPGWEDLQLIEFRDPRVVSEMTKTIVGLPDVLLSSEFKLLASRASKILVMIAESKPRAIIIWIDKDLCYIGDLPLERKRFLGIARKLETSL